MWTNNNIIILQRILHTTCQAVLSISSPFVPSLRLAVGVKVKSHALFKLAHSLTDSAPPVSFKRVKRELWAFMFCCANSTAHGNPSKRSLQLWNTPKMEHTDLLKLFPLKSAASIVSKTSHHLTHSRSGSPDDIPRFSVRYMLLTQRLEQGACPPLPTTWRPGYSRRK